MLALRLPPLPSSLQVNASAVILPHLEHRLAPPQKPFQSFAASALVTKNQFHARPSEESSSLCPIVGASSMAQSASPMMSRTSGGIGSRRFGCRQPPAMPRCRRSNLTRTRHWSAGLAPMQNSSTTC